MGRPVLDGWVSGPEDVREGVLAPSWTNFRAMGAAF